MRRSDNCSCWNAQIWDKANNANHRPTVLILRSEIHCHSTRFIQDQLHFQVAQLVLLLHLYSCLKDPYYLLLINLLQKCASVFVKSSPLTQLLPHQSILPLSSSTFSPKFYFLFHRPEHVTLFTTLLSQYPGIPCCLPIHTCLFSHIHQPLLIFQPHFSKPFYFFLPSNSHKRRQNPHRSPPVRTNVIRINHSLFHFP